jgi:hypothetical protein
MVVSLYRYIDWNGGLLKTLGVILSLGFIAGCVIQKETTLTELVLLFLCLYYYFNFSASLSMYQSNFFPGQPQ